MPLFAQRRYGPTILPQTMQKRKFANFSVLLGAIALSGCVSTSPYIPTVDLGVGYEMNNRVIGHCGTTGVFRVQQPLVPEQIFLGYNHVSAIGCHDDGTLDQLEFFVRFPLAVDK